MLAATPYRLFAMILFLRYLSYRILLVLSRRGPGLHTEALRWLQPPAPTRQMQD